MAYDIPYLLFASPPIGDIAAKHLAQSDYPPVAVITDTKLTTEELIEQVHLHKAGFILVVGFGRILKRELLDSVAGQVLNIHPSLLPEYRGPAPVVQALLDGVEETGVSLMEIDAEMDHGPILAQESIRLSGKETPADLYAILTYKGVQLFLENIEAYLNEDLTPLPQNHAEATYTSFVKKADGLLRLSEDPVINERKIRAYHGWPGTWVMLNNKRLIIHKAHLQSGELRFDEVQPEGGKRMSFSAFCRGQRVSPEEIYQHLLP